MKKSSCLLITIASGIIGGGAGFLIASRLYNKIVERKDTRINKFVGYFNLLEQWMNVREEDKKVSSYFEKNGYYKIALYGLGKIGNRLLRELENTDIQALYAIDTKGESLNANIVVYTPDDEIPEADVIVVTATFDYDNIREVLEEKTNIKVISMDDVIYDLL